ncbi:MAG: DUF3662 domain-containing protein [Calditrichaeota bacterium]|nr:DUF3662 domain-containing protein [Calditrichota bacterium]
MGLRDKLKGVWGRVSDLDDESASAGEQAVADNRIPYKDISRKLKELMKKNVDVVGRKILIPVHYVIYFSEVDRQSRQEVEGVLCDELREELYPEMRKINPEQNKREIFVEVKTDSNLEKGQFQIGCRMKGPEANEPKPAAGEAKPTTPQAPVAAADDLKETVIEQAPLLDPDDQFTIIQTPQGEFQIRVHVKSDSGEEEIAIAKARISVGRSTQDDVTLVSEDFSISRNHATIELREGKYYLLPLGVNGTKLNGKELELKKETEILPNDEIQMLKYTLRIVE